VDFELIKVIVVALIAANVINRVAINPLLNLILGNGSVKAKSVEQITSSLPKSLKSSSTKDLKASPEVTEAILSNTNNINIIK